MSIKRKKIKCLYSKPICLSPCLDFEATKSRHIAFICLVELYKCAMYTLATFLFPTVWYFRIIYTVWYFIIIPTVLLFRIIPTVWYFRIVLTLWYLRIIPTMC
jgi:hypothetical protein